MRISRNSRTASDAAPALLSGDDMHGGVDATGSMGSGISPMQMLAIIRSYWIQILAIWFAVTLVVLVVLLEMPRMYSATATLVVDASSDNTLAGQSAQTDRLGQYLAQQTELIVSPVLLLPVVEKLGLTQYREFTVGFRGDPRALPSYASNRLANALQVQISPNAQLMYISASADSPVMASNIANAVVNQYFAEGQGRAQRYADQLNELRNKVAAAQARLAAFRAQMGLTDVTDLASNTDTEAQALTELEAKLLDAQNVRRSLEARTAGDPTSAEESQASPEVQQLEAQLNDMQTQLAQLSTVYGPRHPKIVALESQIDSTRGALRAQTTKFRTDLTTEVNRARDLEAQYAQAVQTQRDKVMRLRDVQGQGGRLQLELDSARAVYKDALAGYEQASFTSVDKFTNLRLISAASPPASSSKTKKGLWLAEGSFAGLVLGFGLSFGYELLVNRRLRCRDDLERSLGVRVLAQIGPIPPPGQA